MNFDPLTHQRNDVPFDPVDGKPPPPSSASGSQPGLEISWGIEKTDDSLTLSSSRNENGTSSSCTYSSNWIRVQEERWRMDPADFDCEWDQAKHGGAGNLLERNDTAKRILWSNWTEDIIRNPSVSPILFEYNNLRSEASDTEEKRLLKSLYQYGLVLITGTPTKTDSLSDVFRDPLLVHRSNNHKESAESAILHLASLVGYHPLQTLYGPGVWSTSSHSSFYSRDDSDDSASASTADSAYGSTSLPLHTDMTYMSSPPGVQVFLMVQHATSLSSTDEATTERRHTDNTPSVPTGQSVYLDGFAAARQLRRENPEAFQLLATTSRRYRCIDDKEGWHMEASGPVIEAIPRWKVPSDDKRLANCYEWGPVKSIRHNDLDRLPDLPPYTLNEKDVHSSNEFYHELHEAHEAWDNILRRDSMRLVLCLQPGDCILVSNQRCMHGRYAFETSYYPRVVMGCYVGIDELLSKWRANGFRVL
eukprot:CCRYP_002887-RA/>CCRYP_002887-RA protein AED:0.45 eAED:0.45 QI:0/-1/0/1/-1/1/1/0/475